MLLANYMLPYLPLGLDSALDRIYSVTPELVTRSGRQGETYFSLVGVLCSARLRCTSAIALCWGMPELLVCAFCRGNSWNFLRRSLSFILRSYCFGNSGCLAGKQDLWFCSAGDCHTESVCYYTA